MWPGCASPQQPLPRHMIEFEPDPVGVFEQDRIIARRPLVLARGTDDFGVERAEEGVQFIDIGALTGTEAEMVPADALLFEGSTLMLGRRRADPDRGAAADAVIGRLGVDDRFQPEERRQLAIEFTGTLEIRRGQKNMRDAVDFHDVSPVAMSGEDSRPKSGIDRADRSGLRMLARSRFAKFVDSSNAVSLICPMQCGRPCCGINWRDAAAVAQKIMAIK